MGSEPNCVIKLVMLIDLKPNENESECETAPMPVKYTECVRIGISVMSVEICSLGEAYDFTAKPFVRNVCSEKEYLVESEFRVKLKL